MMERNLMLISSLVLGIIMIAGLVVFMIGIQGLGQQLGEISDKLTSLYRSVPRLWDIEDSLESIDTRLYYMEYHLESISDRIR